MTQYSEGKRVASTESPPGIVRRDFIAASFIAFALGGLIPWLASIPSLLLGDLGKVMGFLFGWPAMFTSILTGGGGIKVGFIEASVSFLWYFILIMSARWIMRRQDSTGAFTLVIVGCPLLHIIGLVITVAWLFDIHG